MDYHLVCVHPFGKYARGQMITDADEVATLLDDREHHFVRIAVPAAPVPDVTVADEPKVKPVLKGSRAE
jgi:hypothetical protein